MSQRRYVTIDGEPPFGGWVPGQPMVTPSGRRLIPFGNQGGYRGTGIIGVVYPRPDVGSNPNWRPWDNIPGLPTGSTSTTPTTTRATIPSGAKIPNTDKNLRLPSGVGYIFPKDHVVVHIIEPGYLPWENPRGSFQWRAYKVPIFMTVAEFVGQVCELSAAQKQQQKKTDKGVVAKKAFECIELGNGVWGRGSEFCIGEGKGKDDGMKKTVKKTLGGIGWDAKRGDGTNPPIWVATEAVTK